MLPYACFVVDPRIGGIPLKRTILKILLFLTTGLVSWFLLSFYFFPLGPVPDFPATAPFILEALSARAPLKLVISLLFSLFALFVYEQRSGEFSDDGVQKKD
jgi:hypothetical protein